MCEVCTALVNVTVSDEELAAAANQGAILLDERKPEWFTEDRLDVDALNLESITLCVLGQSAGGYWAGLEMLNLSSSDARAHGFTLRWDATPDSWARLTKTWKAQIAKRREVLVSA